MSDPLRFSRRARELLRVEGYQTRRERAATRQRAVLVLAAEFPEKTTTQLGTAVGYKDHSSVLYALGRLDRKPPALRTAPAEQVEAAAASRPPRLPPLPDAERLAALYAELGTIRYVAKHLGVGEDRLRRAFKKHGIEVRNVLPPSFARKELPEHVTEEDVMAAYLRLGNKATAAKEVGVGESIVRRIVAKHIPDMSAHLPQRIEDARKKRAAERGVPYVEGKPAAAPEPKAECKADPVEVVASNPFDGFDDACRRSLERLRSYPGIVPHPTEHEHGGLARFLVRQQIARAAS